MTYTLSVCDINRILHKDSADKIDGKSVEVVSDGRNLIIDGVVVPVKYDPSFTYYVTESGIYSSRTADEWIKELEWDMNDPKRFWSETYFAMLVNAYCKRRNAK